MQMVIRRALESDIPEIVEIENCSFNVPWPDFLFRAHLPNPGFLVYEDSRILGYAIISSSEDRREAHLLSIAVHKDFRRQGIASRLLEWCVDLAKLYRFNKMVLEVREKNESARFFYASKGFVVEGKTEGYYIDDNAILMGMDL